MFKNRKGQQVLYVKDIHGNIPNSESIIANEDKTVRIYVNPIGYDRDKPKIATVTNANNAGFIIVNNQNEKVFQGIIYHEKANFTDLKTDGKYRLVINGKVSIPFEISKTQICDLCVPIAEKCMEQLRDDAYSHYVKQVNGVWTEVYGTLVGTGIAFYDSHQFSFEIESLVQMYMANPTYWNSKFDVYRKEDCQFTEMRMMNIPSILWLILYTVKVYYDLNVNKGSRLHGLIKGQVAWFLWLYPHITDYISHDYYVQIRDWLISIWSNQYVDLQWYNVGNETHNLYETQKVIGTGKGQYPAGVNVLPNLLMYEVCKRDGLAYSQFYQSWKNNIEWLLKVDMLNPMNGKGQRMSEYITYRALCMSYEMYPNEYPQIKKKLTKMAKTLITRSFNKWDYVQYQTQGDYSEAPNTIWVNAQSTGGEDLYGNGLADIVGNTTGFPAICYMLIRVLDDEFIINRLEELAVSHIDHIFGRNPTGRCYDYHADRDFNANCKGWFIRMIYPNNEESFNQCVGIFDGACKNEQYAYNPTGNRGYTEGWVAFQTPWNTSLAYLMAKDNPNSLL